jgi:hypothetical protein
MDYLVLFSTSTRRSLTILQIWKVGAAALILETQVLWENIPSFHLYAGLDGLIVRPSHIGVM